MQCPRCRQENPPQARFCFACAAPLTRACPRCGTPLPVIARFCMQCGHAVEAGGTELRFPAPEAYTPRHLAEKILTSRSALEGERKQISVLFADLKGSMELLAARDPEEGRKLLDPVLERMMAAVHRYEGTVNQVMGDGIMALFGAPVAHEDHAVRACCAALDMQAAIRALGEEVGRSQGVPLQIRIGINSGEVVVRAIGSDLRMDYTAVGQTTHLAARMEQAAPPGGILLTADTLRLAEGYVEVKPLGKLPIKGLDASVDAWELVGAGGARSRLQAAAWRGLTRFVDREAELAMLTRALHQAGDRHGQVVALVGEPGVGKSRLVWEFTRSRATDGWLVLESSAVSYGQETPYLPVVDLLRACFQIEGRDDRRVLREKVTTTLLALDAALGPTRTPLLALLGGAVEDPEWDALDPPQRRQRTIAALKRLLFRESQVQPLCLVVENLHWIDSESQGFLDSLVESLPGAPVLLVVTYRPEYRHHWGSKSCYTQVRLDPLPPGSAEMLVQALLGDDPGLRSLRTRLIEWTEGNPLFLEESIRTLEEIRVLAGQRGSYRLARPIRGVQVPVTVQSVLAARIDRLPPEEKSLLQSAAVIGKNVPYRLIEAIVDWPPEALHRGLARLQAAEFLRETPAISEIEFTFSHALTHEVAYASLLHERRRALHARLVAAMEALYPGRLVEQAERLAHHAVRGEVWDKALPYLRQAGARAFGHSAYSLAAGWLEEALRVVERLPRSRETVEQAIDLRLDLRAALSPLGQFERILGYLREAEQMALALDDQRRLGLISSSLTNYFQATGELERAVECGTRALDVAVRQQDLAIQVSATAYLSLTYQTLGDYPRAGDLARRTIALLSPDRVGERFGMSLLPAVYARTSLARCRAETGDFREGLAVADEGVRIAESAGHAYSLALALLGLGILHLRRGGVTEAIAALERGFGLVRGGDSPPMTSLVAGFLGSAYAEAERPDEALATLDEALEHARSAGLAGSTLPHGVVLASMGEAHRRAGRLDRAAELGARALAVFEAIGARGYAAWTRLRLAAVAAAQPVPATAVEPGLRDALAVAEALGMRPLAAHCHLALGHLYRRTDRPREAAAALRLALDLFQSMGMPAGASSATGSLPGLANAV